MKKTFTFLFTFLAILFAQSSNGQNIVKVTRTNQEQTINLSTDEVLEIQLPRKAATGYIWCESASTNKTIQNSIVQVGAGEFIHDTISGTSIKGGIVGGSGTQIIRYVGTSQGTTILTLELRRPWEKNGEIIDSYSISVVLDGKYTGTYLPPLKVIKKYNKPLTSTSSTLPSQWDWRPQCTIVKDQKYCGDCWAYATVGTLECNILIHDGVTEDISEEFVTDCFPGISPYICHGCNGGFCAHAAWLSSYTGANPNGGGAVYESEDATTCNSTGHTGTCGAPYTPHETIDSYRDIGSQNADGIPPVDSIKNAIYKYGPIWNRVFANTYAFMHYTGGIINEGIPTDSVTDHAVVLVGWKDTTVSDGSGGYWILRNSWGPNFGNNGYMYISYGSDAIGTAADYIVYKGGIPHAGCNTYAPGSYNSCFNNLTYYTVGNNGYVTGNNVWGDIEKAQKYIGTSGGEIDSVYAYNILISGTSNNSFIALYSVNPTTGAPDSFLGSSYTSSINTSGYTLYQFPNPVTVPSDFFVGVVLPTNTYDTIVVASTQDGCYSGDSLSWEMWSDGTWHSIEHAWSEGFKIDLAILPELCIAPLYANFGASPTSICVGNSVNFTDFSSGNPTSWLWDFGDGNTSTSQNPSHIYNTPGVYDITLTVSNASSSDSYTATAYITVYALPTIAATPTGSTSLCQGTANNNYTTTGATYATSYVWNISPSGAGTISGSGTTGTVNWNTSYTGAATISVKGVNSCGNGTTSNTLSITVNSLPAQPTITPSGSLLTSSAASGNQWYYNGGIISGATSQIYTATQNGAYYVVVTNGYGCSNTSASYSYSAPTAQPFVPELYSTAGDYFVSGSNTLEWSIGECVIETGTGTNNKLTQGFHQSKYVITLINEIANNDYSINIYPNPTADNIVVDIISNQAANIKLKLYDAQGKLLMNQKMRSEEKTKILNLQNFAKGTYILDIYSDNKTLLKTFKIEKINQ